MDTWNHLLRAEDDGTLSLFHPGCRAPITDATCPVMAALNKLPNNGPIVWRNLNQDQN